MNERYRWSVAIGLWLILAGFVGMWAYNLGVSHALVESSRLAALPPVQPGQPVPYVYVWPRPWGFGFGFPLFVLLFWILMVRAFFWRGPWRGGWHRYEGVPPMFDEWHRRAHAEMANGKG
ncbi:MAG TPA: hypothetical protein VHI99_14505 [Vicinamibacterales bacterium]|jgi:hypothetical protein|nr:hypothetical protein [Vicinamibacterales bacterium]